MWMRRPLLSKVAGLVQSLNTEKLDHQAGPFLHPTHLGKALFSNPTKGRGLNSRHNHWALNSRTKGHGDMLNGKSHMEASRFIQPSLESRLAETERLWRKKTPMLTNGDLPVRRLPLCFST
jgi:hypothetical protein